MRAQNISRAVNRLSKIFQPRIVIPKDVIESYKHEGTSKSQRLMMELGLIKQANPGSFTLLPLAMRSLQKLTAIVENEMRTIDSQRIDMPSVTRSKLWETSGRLNTFGKELFQLTDRHDRSYILSPTHEESIADFLSSLSPISYKELPLLLYQITNKYRDEIKPRFGLIRGRQFLMKDLYSFDISNEEAINTYNKVGIAYDNIFQSIGIPFQKVIGNSGPMGGNLSHEYHYLANIGEDKLFKCKNCSFTANLELVESEITCPKCSSDNIEIKTGIEVGHTFLLEEKYTKPFKVNYLNKTGKPAILQMGSYGLGLTRILAAAIEVLSKTNEIRWPNSLVPFKIVIIPPKAGSKEENSTKLLPLEIYNDLDLLPHLNDEVLLDDRSSMTIGKRTIDAKRMGYSFVVIIGGKAMENPPVFEIIDVNSEEILYFSREQLLDFFQRLTLDFVSGNCIKIANK